MEISKEDKERIEKKALEYAIHHSVAPDKETPDWIITDFRSGAEYEHRHLSLQLKEKDEQIKALREQLLSKIMKTDEEDGMY